MAVNNNITRAYLAAILSQPSHCKNELLQIYFQYLCNYFQYQKFEEVYFWGLNPNDHVKWLPKGMGEGRCTEITRLGIWRKTYTGSPACITGYIPTLKGTHLSGYHLFTTA